MSAPATAVDMLFDVFAGDVQRLDLDDGRVGGPLLGEVHHVFGEGRGEQQGSGVRFSVGSGE
ncbi:hypothetical protein ACQX2K_11980 [Corynebacterium diphtheriae]